MSKRQKSRDHRPGVPNPLPEYPVDRPERMCRGWSVTGNDWCGNWARHGRELCGFHGGTTAIGRANGNYKHGRYQQSLPARMVAVYQEALDDPQLMSLRGLVALNYSRLSELFGRLEASEVDIKAILEAKGGLDVARLSGDEDEKTQALDILMVAIEAVSADPTLVWKEIREHMDVVNRMVGTEHRSAGRLDQFVPRAEVVAYGGRIEHIIMSRGEETGIATTDAGRQFIRLVAGDIRELG